MINQNLERDPTSDLQIKLESLEYECKIQAELFHYWGKKAIAINRKLREKKSELQKKKGELDLYYRKNWEELVGTRLSEIQVQTHVEKDEEYLEVQKEFWDLEDKAAELESIKWALTHKKESLGFLSHLWASGYFAHPKVSPEFTEMMDQYREEQTQKVLDGDKNFQKIVRRKKDD